MDSGVPFTVDISKQLKSLGFVKASNSTVMGGFLETKTCCKLGSSDVLLTLNITFGDYNVVSRTGVVLRDIINPPTSKEQLTTFNEKLQQLLAKIPEKMYCTKLKRGDRDNETIS